MYATDLAFNFPSSATILCVLFFLYWAVLIQYNILFHSLAKIPGPFWWRASRLGFIRSFLAGNLVRDVRKLHEKYGNIVRIAPDEISFACEEIWSDAFGRNGHNPLPRNPTFFKTPPGQPDNLVMTADTKASARMRQVMMPAFTERALTRQELIIQTYTNLLMSGLSKITTSGTENMSIINIVDWYNWFAFDLIGELAFGESFGSLEETRHHPWVAMIFGSIKVMAFAAVSRYYTGFEALLSRLIPSSIRKMQKDHYAMALEKIHRRMNSSKKDDFMSPMLDDNPNFERMSRPEIESTMALMIIAGSETTATTLCGITNCLVQTPSQLRKLEGEIRRQFDKEEDITLRAIQNLPFLNAVILEGLRMCHPVAGGILRFVPKGGSNLCGYFLPENTHVLVSTAAMSLSETNFHRAGEFLPERFLPEDTRPVEFENDNRSSQKPFGLGPRSCIGKSFALAEMRLVLARLLWRFDIAMAPGCQVDWNMLKTFVVVEKKAINIAIKGRAKTSPGG